MVQLRSYLLTFACGLGIEAVSLTFLRACSSLLGPSHGRTRQMDQQVEWSGGAGWARCHTILKPGQDRPLASALPFKGLHSGPL